MVSIFWDKFWQFTKMSDYQISVPKNVLAMDSNGNCFKNRGDRESFAHLDHKACCRPWDQHTGFSGLSCMLEDGVQYQA